MQCLYKVQNQYNVQGAQFNETPMHDVPCTMHCFSVALCTIQYNVLPPPVVRCTMYYALPFWPEHCSYFYMEAKRKITRFEDLIVKELERIGVLKSRKAGKEKLYLNVRLYELLAG